MNGSLYNHEINNNVGMDGKKSTAQHDKAKWSTLIGFASLTTPAYVLFASPVSLFLRELRLLTAL